MSFGKRGPFTTVILFFYSHHIPYYLISKYYNLLVGGLVAKSCPTLATPWTEACQTTLFIGFSRQQYWSGLPFSFSMVSSQPRNQTWISCTAGRFLYLLSYQGSSMYWFWSYYLFSIECRNLKTKTVSC